MILFIVPMLNCLLITHLNWTNRRLYFSRWRPCFGFSVCPCYNRRTRYYPTLEKPAAQNITACESQGKQRELSDHWKLKKRFFQKITGDDAKRTKRLTEMQVLTKTFTKRVFKKMKVTHYLNQSTVERSLLIHGQINLIKFVESNKFDKVYNKIWNIFAWSNFFKVWFIKLVGWKTSNKILNHHKEEKLKKIKLQMNQHEIFL